MGFEQRSKKGLRFHLQKLPAPTRILRLPPLKAVASSQSCVGVEGCCFESESELMELLQCFVAVGVVASSQIRELLLPIWEEATTFGSQSCAVVGGPLSLSVLLRPSLLGGWGRALCLSRVDARDSLKAPRIDHIARVWGCLAWACFLPEMCFSWRNPLSSSASRLL